MSVGAGIIECMFGSDASPQAVPAFVGVDDAGVVDAITAAAREQNAICAQELAAIGELYARRAPEDDVDRENWAIDGHENVVAEVGAALGVSRGRARGGCGMRSRCGSGCPGSLRFSREGSLISG
jgi:Domain of unknown function (DUF222)